MHAVAFIIDCCILPISYIFGFFFITKFDMNDIIIKNVILFTIYVIVYPVLFILTNNMLLHFFGKKTWKNWITVSKKYEKIINNFEIGFLIILMFPFVYFVKKAGISIKFLFQNNGNINNIIFIIIYALIGIIGSKLIMKIFIRD